VLRILEAHGLVGVHVPPLEVPPLEVA
jgi:hypothetical protein